MKVERVYPLVFIRVVCILKLTKLLRASLGWLKKADSKISASPNCLNQTQESPKGSSENAKGNIFTNEKC